MMNNTTNLPTIKLLLIIIAIGIWVLIFQNIGLIPCRQNVYVSGGGLDAEVSGKVEVEGSVDVSGSVDIDNTVDVNLQEILGRPAGCSTSYKMNGEEYQSLHVNIR